MDFFSSPFFSFQGLSKVDSFRVLVPLTAVLSYPSDLDKGAEIAKVRISSGEVLQVSQPVFYLPAKSDEKLANDIPLTVSSRRVPGKESKYLEFLLTSHTASCGNYFGGITPDGVIDFFNNLKKYGFLFSPNFLASAFFIDFDFCIDFRFATPSVYGIENLAKGLSDASGGAFKIIYQKNDEGLKVCTGGYQYARQGFPFSKVYLKVYDKYIDSLRRTSFTPFERERMRGLYRVEFTVKNQRHLDFLNVRCPFAFTFLSLFSDSSLFFRCVFSYCFPSFSAASGGLSKRFAGVGKDKFISFLFDSLKGSLNLEKCLSIYQTFLDSSDFSPVQKTRYKIYFLENLFSKRKNLL